MGGKKSGGLIMDFDDCFIVNRPKDYIGINKRNLTSMISHPQRLIEDRLSPVP